MNFRCPFCHEEFARKEHLNRHKHRHTGLKPFKCQSCPKSFSRRDTLLRHNELHDRSWEKNARSPASGPSRKAPACVPCKRSKLHCSGVFPCDRCKAKSRNCEYPPVKRGATSLVPSSSSNSTKPSDCRSISQTASANNPPLQTVNLTVEPPVCDSVTIDTSSAFARPSSGRPFFTLSRSEIDFESRIPHHQGPTSFEWSTDLFIEPFIWESFFNMDFDPSVQPLQQDHIQATSTQMGSKNSKPYDEDILQGEDFCHVEEIDLTAYQSIQEFHQEHGCDKPQSVPPFRVIYTFVQLYFEHFDRRYPFVHPALMNIDHTSWILLLAVATVGCRYSAIDSAQQCGADLQELLSQAISQNLPADLEQPNLSLIQSMLLMNVCLIFGGSNAHHNKLARSKNLILTLFDSLNPSQIFRQRESLSKGADGQDSERWVHWLIQETYDRLAISIMRFEQYQLLFFDVQILNQSKRLLNRLPCDEPLWRCRNATDWRDKWVPSQYSKPTLASLMKSNGKFYIFTGNTLSALAIEILMLAMYVEERTTTEQLALCPLVDGMSTIQRIRLELHDKLSSKDHLGAASCDEMTTNVDGFFEILTHDYLSSKTQIPSEANMVIFHLLYILRKVPLRKLAAHTGWQANERDTELAKIDLEQWMRMDRASARWCLWHAVSIYRYLHDKPTFECHGPLSFVIASLYIWAFDTLMCQGHSSAGVDGITTGRSGLVRIDRVNGDELNAWITSSNNDRIHLSGIGIFNGEKSSNRLLMQVRKALSGRQPWSRLCHGLAYMVGLTVKELQVESVEWRRNDRIPPEGDQIGSA